MTEISQSLWIRCKQIGFHVGYFILSTGLIVWLAAGQQAGSSGIYLFLIHDVATDTTRLSFLLGFVFLYAVAFSATAYTLRLPRVDFFNRIVAITIICFSFFGLGFSALRLTLVSREVLVSEFGLFVVLLAAYYVTRNKLFPRRIGALKGVDISSLNRHPALSVESTTLESAPASNFELVIAKSSRLFNVEDSRSVAALAKKGIRISHADTFIERIWGRVPLDELTLADVEEFASPTLYKNVKRFGELMLILTFAPLLAITGLFLAMIIRLDSPGPVLFRQQRAGYLGESFTMLKFRSMVSEGSEETRFAEKHDSRVTRVGRLLRRFRLDELPQLWNVVRGEMSLIGPRPEQEQFTWRFDQLIPFYGFRHSVPPGISGWAQVMYGYAATDEQTCAKLEFDFYYIKHMSLWMDIVVVVKTIRTILLGSGAR